MKLDQYSNQELLQELSKRLEIKNATVDDLVEQLKTTNQRLEESEAMKSHFLSNITNEIVNPFTSIIGLSKNILSVQTEDWRRVISMVALIHSEAFNLDFQLKNIFMAATVEGGAAHPEISKVDVFRLVEEIKQDFKFEAKRRKVNLSIDFDISPTIGKVYNFRTDAEKVNLIITNLVSNAIKFSPRESDVEIYVSMDGDRLRVDVKNHGSALSEEELIVIFDRFKRLDNNINSLNTGHGLGLSVTQALVDILGGEIQYFCEEGNKISFSIFLSESEDNAPGAAFNGHEFLFEDFEDSEDSEVF